MQHGNTSTEAIDALGLDCAGVITEVGRGVDRFKIGDWVGALTSGAFATSHAAPQALCFGIPDGKTFEEAAALPFAYGTAIHALIDKGKLGNGMVSDRLSFLLHASKLI